MRRLVTMVVLAAAALMAFVPAAEAAKAWTTLTTHGVHYAAPSATVFNGSVVSLRKACVNRRLVIVFRQRRGPDQKIGTTRAKPGYTWRLKKPGLLPHGTYYAVVRATGQCSRARSLDYVGPG
jgi:hypothetical protein